STPLQGLGLTGGDLALCESSRGSLRVRVEITDELQPGVVSMPHGYGMVEDESQYGPAVNELTDAARCDTVAKTPFHKYVPVRITALDDGRAAS
ncbi:MAG: molybdopterin dinucleotide binding domain-containing protein, partial [Acidobacteriota bacterium]